MSQLNQSLTHREKLDLLCDAARGLAYLHENKIAHGDVASSNIMVDERLVAKISDLGEAHVIDRTLTVINPVNPEYCAPEKKPGAAVDPFRSDCYSLGVVMVHTCTAQPPDVTRREVQLMHIASPPLRAVARMCTDLSPANRPAVGHCLTQLLLPLRAMTEYQTCGPRRRAIRVDGKALLL